MTAAGLLVLGLLAQATPASATDQRRALELGYAALSARDPETATRQFRQAAAGPDGTLSEQARAEQRYLPRHFWADVYGESFGWSRSQAAAPLTDLASTVRARALWRPRLDLDVSLYLFAQAARDVASRGGGALPRIYADNQATFGAGALARFWGGRAGAFGQVGPALALVDDGRERLRLDARLGLFLSVASAGCAGGGPGFRVVPCLESYGEATYVSRYDHNVIGFGRGRAGVSYLSTGPVRWQMLGELRAGVDRNQDYYNNLADVGLAHRWRLMAAVPFDLLLGAHGGRFLGMSGRDPLPARRGYLDLRLVASTYVSF
jgi:hypothetical protein